MAQVERLRNFFREHPVGDADGDRGGPAEQQRGGSGGTPSDARLESFREALADDFNTPRAMAEVFELVAERTGGEVPGGDRALKEMLELVGLSSLTQPDKGAEADERPRSCWWSARRLGRRRILSGPMRFATGSPSSAGRCATRRVAPGSCRRPDGHAVHLRQAAGRGGGAGEAAGAPGLEGAGGHGRGAGAALWLARPPGRRRRGRAVSLRRPQCVAAREDALIVALDQVQDPRNLGAVCRSAEPAGAAGLVIPERRAAEVTAVACKASAGAVEHLAIARVRNLADWLGEAKEAGFWIWGADAGGPAALGGRPERPDDPRHGRRGEGDPTAGRLGLRRAGRPASWGKIDSLNVSAAAAALLFEAVRQRWTSTCNGGCTEFAIWG